MDEPGGDGCENNGADDGQPGGSAESFLSSERVERARTKRVKLVDDDENWSLGSASSGPEPPDGFNDRARQISIDMLATSSSPPPPGFDDSNGHAPGTNKYKDNYRTDRPTEHQGRQSFVPTIESGSERERANRRARPQTAARVPLAAEQVTQAARNNKRISFAPTTTFIDQDGGRSRRQFERQQPPTSLNHAEGQRARVLPQERQRFIASPEPSIDENLEETIIVHESNSFKHAANTNGCGEVDYASDDDSVELSDK